MRIVKIIVWLFCSAELTEDVDLPSSKQDLSSPLISTSNTDTETAACTTRALELVHNLLPEDGGAQPGGGQSGGAQPGGGQSPVTDESPKSLQSGEDDPAGVSSDLSAADQILAKLDSMGDDSTNAVSLFDLITGMSLPEVMDADCQPQLNKQEPGVVSGTGLAPAVKDDTPTASPEPYNSGSSTSSHPDVCDSSSGDFQSDDTDEHAMAEEDDDDEFKPIGDFSESDSDGFTYEDKTETYMAEGFRPLVTNAERVFQPIVPVVGMLCTPLQPGCDYQVIVPTVHPSNPDTKAQKKLPTSALCHQPDLSDDGLSNFLAGTVMPAVVCDTRYEPEPAAVIEELIVPSKSMRVKRPRIASKPAASEDQSDLDTHLRKLLEGTVTPILVPEIRHEPELVPVDEEFIVPSRKPVVEQPRAADDQEGQGGRLAESATVISQQLQTVQQHLPQQLQHPTANQISTHVSPSVADDAEACVSDMTELDDALIQSPTTDTVLVEATAIDLAKIIAPPTSVVDECASPPKLNSRVSNSPQTPPVVALVAEETPDSENDLELPVSSVPLPSKHSPHSVDDAATKDSMLPDAEASAGNPTDTLSTNGTAVIDESVPSALEPDVMEPSHDVVSDDDDALAAPMISVSGVASPISHSEVSKDGSPTDATVPAAEDSSSSPLPDTVADEANANAQSPMVIVIPSLPDSDAFDGDESSEGADEHATHRTNSGKNCCGFYVVASL